MTVRDDWSSDPSVRAMRGLFSGMEAGQDDLLKEVGISSHDSRLRPCREEARDFFERVDNRNQNGWCFPVIPACP